MREVTRPYASNGMIGLMFSASGTIAVILAVGAAGGAEARPARIVIKKLYIYGVHHRSGNKALPHGFARLPVGAGAWG